MNEFHGSLLLLICMILGCTQKSEIPEEIDQSIEAIPLLKLSSQEVILDPASTDFYLFKNRAIKSVTISELDYDLMKQVLDKAIADGKFAFLSHPTREFIFSSYCFQYIPYVDEKGNKIIYLNAFCQFPGEEMSSGYIQEVFDWRRYFIDMHDGGPCYWSVQLNLNEMTYEAFSVNGHA